MFLSGSRLAFIFMRTWLQAVVHVETDNYPSDFSWHTYKVT